MLNLPPPPLSELHACSSVPARGEGSGVSHNSGVAWDVEGQNSRGGKTRVARASQVSRKSQLLRDTLLVLPGRLCSQNGISLRCRFLVLQTTTACAAKKPSEVSGLRSKTLRLSSFYWLQFGKSPPCFPGLAPGVKSPILAAVTILLSSNTWAGRQTVPTQKQIFCGWDQVSEYIFWSVQVSFWYFGPNDLYPIPTQNMVSDASLTSD